MSKEGKLLNEVVNRLVTKLPARVKAIILCGSRARGDWTPWSDYDLLIIADFREKYLDRIKNILEIIGDLYIDVEPHPYTLNEAIEMLRKGNPLIVDALEEGKILYSTNDFKKLINVYKELKEKGMMRTNTTIIVPP